MVPPFRYLEIAEPFTLDSVHLSNQVSHLVLAIICVQNNYLSFPAQYVYKG